MNSSQIGGPHPPDGNICACWKDVAIEYENRNAMLEQPQGQLSERLRATECALPSILVSAMVSVRYGTEPPRMDSESVLSTSGVAASEGFEKIWTEHGTPNADELRVETVYKRENDEPELNRGNCSESRRVPRPENCSPSKFSNGDDGVSNNDEVGETVASLSVLNSRDSIALARVQELAEQERSSKRYILDSEGGERTFCETLEKANGPSNDPPLRYVPRDCSPLCSGSAARWPIPDDPVTRRLQKLQYYNKRMIACAKGLRMEKNVLVKQNELLKSQLKNTQRKLGEVRKEVSGESKNKDDEPAGGNSSPKTLEDLAGQFEDVLQKAKNYGLCKLTGTIKDAATKLKQLSKSDEAYKCVCSCPCDPTFEQAGPCPNCKCGKFDLDRFGETGDWVCESCGGECVCDLVSLAEDDPETGNDELGNCECGCRNDAIACECGCAGTTETNEVGEAGDIPKTVAKKVAEDVKGIICTSCGNCKCGDDHSRCPDRVQACTCSARTASPDTVREYLRNTGNVRHDAGRQPQDPGVRAPRCACNDSDGVRSPGRDAVAELGPRAVFLSEKNGDPRLRPSFESEQSEPCDICLEEEEPKGSDKPETFDPCDECLELREGGSKIGSTCSDSCQPPESTNTDCPCGCGLAAKLSHSLQEFGCDCECAEGGVHCDFCCCVESIGAFLEADKPTDAVSESPETCPCIEDDIREVETEELAKTLQQHVESIAKKNNLLRQLVARCACTTSEVAEDSCPAEGCSYHDPAPVRRTASGLRAAVEILRLKSRRKDGMIAVMAENLGAAADPDKIIELLATPRFADARREDFDHGKLYGYLKGLEFDRVNVTDTTPNEHRYFSGIARHEPQQSPENNEIRSTGAETWSRSPVPAPRNFRVVEQIYNDCLLVTWTPPEDTSILAGYEILANGNMVSRVTSPTRTEALLVSPDISRPTILTLYSLGRGGSLSDPVRTTYPTCPCSREL